MDKEIFVGVESLSPSAEADQIMMEAHQNAMNTSRYDIPVKISQPFALSTTIESLLYTRFNELTGNNNNLRAKRFLFMLRNDGQDYSQLTWCNEVKPAFVELSSGSNSDEIEIITINESTTAENKTEPKDQATSENKTEATKEAIAEIQTTSNDQTTSENKPKPTIAAIQTNTPDQDMNYIKDTEGYTTRDQKFNFAKQAYEDSFKDMPPPLILSHEEKVELFWKTVYLIPNDISMQALKLPEAWWRDHIFVPLVFNFRQVLGTSKYFWIPEKTMALAEKVTPKSGRTDGGLVLKNDLQALAILFEYKTYNQDSFAKTVQATAQASQYCKAGLRHRHKLWPNAKHRVIAIIGEGSIISAQCVSLEKQQQQQQQQQDEEKSHVLAIESFKHPKKWNLSNFEEVFGFAVFLTSLTQFLLEEDRKCTRKRPRSEESSETEERDAKKQKLMPVTSPFVVPFYQRKTSDGTFAALSKNAQDSASLLALIKTKEMNLHLLAHSSDTITTNTLVKLQGCIGVPTLLAYRCYTVQSLHQYLIDTADYTELPVPDLPLKSMIEQYIHALIEYHKHCLSLGRDFDVKWQGQNIKFIQWDSCGFRGDASNDERGKPADSLIDMLELGRTIQIWSEKLNSQEFLPLSKSLMNDNHYQRLSPEFALKVLHDATLLNEIAALPYKSLHNALRWQSEIELNKLIVQKLYATKKKKRNQRLKDTTWTEEIPSEGIRLGKAVSSASGTELHIAGKTLDISFTMHWGVALEFFTTWWMSGKKYLPLLLDFEFFQDNDIDKLRMIFPAYHKEPKKKNILQSARQLLTAVKILHESHIVHCDIAPANIMWDNNDDLVLIDFGSTFWFNHVPEYEYHETSQATFRSYGHAGFMPEEKARYPVTDVFSAGRTIAHWADHWHQELTSELKDLIQMMTHSQWYKRISVDGALARLEEIERPNFGRRGTRIDVLSSAE